MSQSQSQTETPLAAVTLAYHDGPTGNVVVTEAALNAVRRTRAWAIVFAVVLFVYAAAGLTLGTIWLVVLIQRRGEPGFPVPQFLVISTFNLLFAPVALLGGVLVMRYVAAAGRAYFRRSTAELERAMKRQLAVWRWAGLVVAAVFACPVIILGIAAALNVWP